MTIGERILQIIKEKGLKQKDLAEHLGTKPSTVNGWSKPNRNPSSELIIPICEFLDVTPEFLLTGKEKKSDVSISDAEWLDLIHKLPPETQRDFMGMMRIYIDTHPYMLEESEEEPEEMVN